MKPPDKLYSFHVDNLRAIDTAIHRLALAFRRAISLDDKHTVASFTPLYALLLGAWAECRLQKLLYEPQGFAADDRQAIRCVRSHFGRWQAAVELAFRIQYGVRKAPLTGETLPHSAHSRYLELNDLLSTELRPIIELRNKLAHGQWAYPLNKDGTDVAEQYLEALRCENLLSLQFKKALLGYLAEAINDLVLSRPAFERDFDTHFRRIVAIRRNLATQSFATYAAHLREKYLRGTEKRPAAAPGPG